MNISGGENTPEIVNLVHKKYDYIPIIATGGKTEDSIKKTIKAGANAISYTPPSSAELFKQSMLKYRNISKIKD